MDTTPKRKPLVVSLNIPFRTRRCSFDASPLVKATGDRAAGALGGVQMRMAYPDALVAELESIAPDLANHEVKAVCVQGVGPTGNPTLCPTEGIVRALRRLRQLVTMSPDAQVSMRTLASTIGADAAGQFKSAGLRRYEFYVGSFNLYEWSTLDWPVSMEALGQSRQILACYGIDDYGAVLNWGLPGQTQATMRESVDKALEEGVAHVRLEYAAPVEGTSLHRQFVMHEDVLDLPRHDLALPDKEACESIRAAAAQELARNGFTEYLPGCFALPGHEDLYAILRSRGCDEMALGCSGVSTIDGLRTTNIDDPVAYIAHAGDPTRVVATVEDLTL